MTHAPWIAEVPIDAGFAAELLSAAFPDAFGGLSAALQQFETHADRSACTAPVRWFGEGWDNVAFLVDARAGGGEPARSDSNAARSDTLVARFPKRQLGAELMARELRAVPAIRTALANADQLALDVPDVRWRCAALAGAPRGYAWPFGMYPLMRGETSCRVSLPVPQQRAGAVKLGTFLAHLHALGPSLERVAAPERASTRDAARRLNTLAARLGEFDAATWTALGVEQAARAETTRAFLQAVEELLQTPHWSAGGALPALVHGDLYGRHVLVECDATGVWQPTGLIDWGDTHLGDAADDLSLAWTYFAGAERAAFLDAYTALRPIGIEALLQRARLRALEYAVLLTHYGAKAADPEVLNLGLTAWRGACGAR